MFKNKELSKLEIVCLLCCYSVELDLRCNRYKHVSRSSSYFLNNVNIYSFHRSVGSTEDITLDSESANPGLLISSDEKHMRCGLERRDVTMGQGCFDSWWCAVGREGYTTGRHYWEVEVGERDWRLGVAKASAVRQGFRSLNTDTGYLTIRLERGTDLKALTVPTTPLPQNLAPKKVGIYLDYEQGQLSFYDVEKRSHLFTYNENFTETLYPLFGTVEVVKDLVIRPAGVREPCLCPGPCLWN